MHSHDLYFFSAGAIISSGLTYLSKSASLITLSSMALSLRVIPFLWAFLAVLEAASYPLHQSVNEFERVVKEKLTNDRVKTCDKHQAVGSVSGVILCISR